jgi:hypothetical protein
MGGGIKVGDGGRRGEAEDDIRTKNYEQSFFVFMFSWKSKKIAENAKICPYCSKKFLFYLSTLFLNTKNDLF